VIEDANQRRVPSRDDQREVRHRRCIGLEVDRAQVTLEVVYADERQLRDPRDRLRGLVVRPAARGDEGTPLARRRRGWARLIR
jgi:hypothetical protein